MNLYISDLHFGHNGVIITDKRPFMDVNDMDATMIRLWNERVAKEDHVYIVGDFMHRSEKRPSWYLRQLKGYKHLVLGNHDRETLQDEDAMFFLESADKTLIVEDFFEGKRIQVCLNHYPMTSWYNSDNGSWLVYGHIHNRKVYPYDVMKSITRALNAGACINNYKPVSFDELYENNKQFQMI